MVSRIAWVLAFAGATVSASASDLPSTAPATSPAAASPATEPASPLYTELMGDYMLGHWDVLETTLKEKTPQVARLSTTEQGDIAAIRLALKDGRPDWWAITKSGKKGQIMPLLWGRKIPVQFDPATKTGADTKIKNGLLALSAGWPIADMDSTAPAAGNIPAAFSKGDVACLTAFTNLGAVDAASQIPAGGTELQKERYEELRGKLTAIAYATPPARRCAIWACLASFTEENPKPPIRMGKRAVGEMFIQEILYHPQTYPSIQLPQKTIPADKAEEVLGLALADFVAGHPWTFAEDNALKAAAKQFAVANGIKTFTTGIVNFPNKLTMTLDPNEDVKLLPERNAWLKKEFDKAGGGK